MPRKKLRGKTYVGAEIDDAHFAALQELAVKEQRSVSSMLRIILTDWFQMYNERAAKKEGADAQAVKGSTAI